MSFGEVGSLTRGGFGVGEIVRIDFTEPLDNAIIHLSSTNGGGNEFSLRVVSVDANGFNFVLEEWEDEDGPHPATETINWIAVEPGTHVMEDGRVIEAGTTIASTTTSSVALNGSYTDTPVILTNVMSQNETDVVDSDPSNVTTSGFDVTLQEGSLVDGVNNGETVGYIAISTDTTSTDSFSSVQDGLNSGNNDFALGGTLTNGAVFAETQTLNEAGSGNVAIAANDIDGSNANVTMRFDEETGDGNSAHGNESVGLVGLEIGLILCFAADTMIETTEGQQRCADLAPGDLVVGADGKEKPLRQVLRRDLGWVELATNPRLWPVRIAAGALGQDLPRRDLLVSRQHRMLVSSRIAERMFGTEEVLVPAIRLVGLPGIECRAPADGITYVHLVFDAHEVVLAEGAPAESLFTGPEAMKSLPAEARAELLTLFPQLSTPGHEPVPARVLAPGPRARRLIDRHSRNGVRPLQTWRNAPRGFVRAKRPRWEVAAE